MLKDPLNLIETPTDTETLTFDGALVPFALVPSGPAGQIVRVGTLAGLESALAISHSVTNENKPYGTKRVNVRLSSTKVDSETGNSVTGFVQESFGLPKAVFTPAELNVMRQSLLAFLLFGETVTGHYSTIAEGTVQFNRLLLGES